nr:uncharacterized protein LOC124819107 [Hydra vulgaris]
MDRFIKTDRLGIDPNSTDAAKTYNHWLRTFYNFVSAVDDNSIKLNLLINHIEPDVNSYQSVMILKEQQSCTFTAASVEQYKSEMICDAFINGLLSNHIRQHLLENKILDLSLVFDQARSLEVAQQNSNLYSQSTIPTSASMQEIKSSLQKQSITDNHLAATVKSKQLCWFCGNITHPPSKYPAHEAGYLLGGYNHKEAQSFYICHKSSANSLFRVCHNIIVIYKYKAEALIDSGSTNKSFINNKLVVLLNLNVIYEQSVIGIASASLSAKSDGYCFVSKTLQNKIYSKVKLYVLDNLCIDIILGTDFQELHESITIKYGGKRPPITFAALTIMKTEPPELFANLTKDCQLIATRSRNYFQRDKEFIKSEVHRLIQAGIIEPTLSKKDRPYTAFEADNKLWLYTRMPFGITNGSFRLAAIDAGITFKEEKCVFSTETLDFLDYRISYDFLKPYSKRLAPLIKLPPSDNVKSLQHIIGMFSYYARKFSDEIRPLNSVTPPAANISI